MGVSGWGWELVSKSVCIVSCIVLLLFSWCSLTFVTLTSNTSEKEPFPRCLPTTKSLFECCGMLSQYLWNLSQMMDSMYIEGLLLWWEIGEVVAVVSAVAVVAVSSDALRVKLLNKPDFLILPCDPLSCLTVTFLQLYFVCIGLNVLFVDIMLWLWLLFFTSKSVWAYSFFVVGSNKKRRGEREERGRKRGDVII